MSLVAERAAAIATRARTLDELLAAGEGRTPAETSEEARRMAAEILDRWRFSVARGDHGAFERRLAWDGLTADGVLERLVAGLENPHPPAWSTDLVELLEAAATTPSGECTDGRATPFGDLWRAVARRWRTRLAVGEGIGVELATTACDDLEDHLVRQLSRVSTEALWERFAAFSVAVGPAVEGSRRVYDAFVAELRGGGLVEVLEAVPVLARQLVRLADTWLEAAVELAQRIAESRSEIERALAGGQAVGPVVAVQTGLSDRHRGGRRVQVLELGSGLKLVYKPRDVAVEAAFHGLFDALAGAGLEEAPPRLRCVMGDGYGFFEHAAVAEPADAEAVHRWFRRAGALVCVTGLLRAVDLHMDNIVATAEGPVLVDAESILQPDRPDRPSRGDAVPQPDPDCVLHSALVSFLTVDPRGGIAEISGLCGRGGHLAAADERTWRDMGLDTMAPVSGDRRALPEVNLVHLCGVVQAAERFAADVAAGFAATHRFLRRYRGELLAPGGPLELLSGVRVRTLLRDSNQYAAVMAATMAPRFQRQGWATGVLADSLNRAAVAAADTPPEWPAAAAERRSLDGLDIPLLQVAANGTDLEADGGVRVRGLYPRPAFATTCERLRRLDEAALERQFTSLEWLLPGPATSDAALASPLVRTAEVIGQRLLDRALNPDGSLRRSTTHAGTEHEAVVELSVYGGACGVAVFLAALAAVTSEPRFAAAARSMAAPVERWLGTVAETTGDVPLGACHGLGGIAWTGAVVGRLLDDGWWLELGCAAAAGITPARALADRRLDVEGGAAGAILGLLALHEATGQDELLERAVVCGQRLLAGATPATTGGAGWAGTDGAMRAGFAHGAAGVVAALSGLAAATGFAPFAEAAREGLVFERGLFDPSARNWPVLVQEADGGERRLFLCAWCHGAPGILLGRLRVGEELDDAAVQGEIEAAIATTLAAGVGRSDHLCCGTMGRVDALMTTGLRLGSVELSRAAATRAVMTVRRAVCDGRFCFHPSDEGPEPYAPGLFRGEAGVGYQLLRLAHPDRVPSVLVFEAPASRGTSGVKECGGRTL